MMESHHMPLLIEEIHFIYFDKVMALHHMTIFHHMMGLHHMMEFHHMMDIHHFILFVKSLAVLTTYGSIKLWNYIK